MDNRRLIDADKLLEWIEKDLKADGFWLGTCAVEAFDNLTDAINQGTFDPDPIPPTIKPGDKVRIINTADHRYINQEAIVKEVDPAPPGCAKLEGISRYWLLSSLEVVSHD